MWNVSSGEVSEEVTLDIYMWDVSSGDMKMPTIEQHM